MEMQLAACTDLAQISTPTNGARSIFDRIESELNQSEVYQQVMEGLEAIAGEAANHVQALIKALGREAIRVSFQQIAQRYQVVPVTSKRKATTKKTSTVGTNPTVAESSTLEVETEKPLQTEIEPSLTPVESETLNPEEETANPKVSSLSQYRRRLSKAQKAQLLVQEREEIFAQIGQNLRQAREAQGMSIGQLYSKTLVQVFYIKAIESGRMENLPEDIYLRGFIRRIGNALKLDGNALANSLPKPNEKIVPSWYAPDLTSSSLNLTPVHLYVGYTALVAGAVGGLALLSSHQGKIGAFLEPDNLAPTESVSQSTKYAEHQNSGLEQAGASIAPPEAIN